MSLTQKRDGHDIYVDLVQTLPQKTIEINCWSRWTRGQINQHLKERYIWLVDIHNTQHLSVHVYLCSNVTVCVCWGYLGLSCYAQQICCHHAASIVRRGSNAFRQTLLMPRNAKFWGKRIPSNLPSHTPSPHTLTSLFSPWHCCPPYLGSVHNQNRIWTPAPQVDVQVAQGCQGFQCPSLGQLMFRWHGSTATSYSTIQINKQLRVLGIRFPI